MFAKEETNRSMKQNKEPRNRPRSAKINTVNESLTRSKGKSVEQR